MKMFIQVTQTFLTEFEDSCGKMPITRLIPAHNQLHKTFGLIECKSFEKLQVRSGLIPDRRGKYYASHACRMLFACLYMPVVARSCRTNEHFGKQLVPLTIPKYPDISFLFKVVPAFVHRGKSNQCEFRHNV